MATAICYPALAFGDVTRNCMLGRREFVEKASTPRKKNARLVRYLSENSSNATKEKKASERPIAHKLPTGFGSIAELPTSPVRKVRWGNCPRAADTYKPPKSPSAVKCTRCRKVLDMEDAYRKFSFCMKCYCKRAMNMADEGGWTPEEAAEFIRVSNWGA